MKLARKNLNKILDLAKNGKLSGSELSFITHIIQFQDERGNIEGLHYKSVAEAIGIVPDYFYKAKNNLEAQGVIKVDWNGDSAIHGYWNITILDNVFKSKQDYKKGYINCNLEFLQSKEFHNLSTSEKIVVLHILKNMHAHVQECFEEIQEIKDRYKKEVDYLKFQNEVAEEMIKESKDYVWVSLDDKEMILYKNGTKPDFRMKIAKLKQEMIKEITEVKPDEMPVSYNGIAHWTNTSWETAKNIAKKLSKVINITIERAEIIVFLQGISNPNNNDKNNLNLPNLHISLINKLTDRSGQTESQIRNCHLIRYILRLTKRTMKTSVVNSISKVFHIKKIKTLKEMFENLCLIDESIGKMSSKKLNSILISCT